MRINNENLLDESGPLDLSESQNLSAIYLGHIAHYSIQLVYSGSPKGTFKLQASNDPGRINAAEAVNQAPISNWTDVADSAVEVSAAGNNMWTVQNSGYNWVRVVWTNDDGAGTLESARAYVKGV